MEITFTLMTLAIAGVCLFPALILAIIAYDCRKQLHKVPLLPLYAVMYTALGVAWYAKGFWTPTEYACPSVRAKLSCLGTLLAMTISFVAYPMLLHLCYNDGNLEIGRLLSTELVPLWAQITGVLSLIGAGLTSIVVLFFPLIYGKSA